MFTMLRKKLPGQSTNGVFGRAVGVCEGKVVTIQRFSKG